MHPPVANLPKPWLRPALIGLTILLAAVLLFARLGHDAFWDDEAATALGAKAILRTGKNTAFVGGGNLVAYRSGAALHGFDNRIEPLLPPYLTAASFVVFGMNTWAARLPFALFGLGTVALLLWWARRERWQTVAVLGFALLGSVPFFLYARNCRYYAAATFFSVALVFLYRRGRPTVANAFAFAGLASLLFLSNSLNYAALCGCLGLDYLLWQRRESPLGWRLLCCAFLPQMVVVGLVMAFWNPLQTPHGGNLAHNTLGERLTMFWWEWRDTNVCEQLCLPLLLVALGVGVARRRPLLVRGCVALVVYFAAMAALSPQLLSELHKADVRYLAPVIPLAVGLEVATLCVLLGRWTLPLLGAAVVVFGTNLANGGFLFDPEVHSTLASYVQELADPPDEPYGPVAAWINAHVPAGKTILVGPRYAAYPLMFYAPKAVYAWQFDDARPEYAMLPPIHFVGRVAPDYLVTYGPYLDQVSDAVDQTHFPGVSYEHVATINVYWQAMDRPELFWHSFGQVDGFDPDSEAVQIFQRTDVPR
ncbi:MAG: hypothetical protein INR65_16700 [Gluconacetobacter diazotrophicus]|nr:hypothetical protein [Gluconacetobacter diazotrophicus]